MTAPPAGRAILLTALVALGCAAGYLLGRRGPGFPYGNRAECFYHAAQAASRDGVGIATAACNEAWLDGAPEPDVPAAILVETNEFPPPDDTSHIAVILGMVDDYAFCLETATLLNQTYIDSEGHSRFSCRRTLSRKTVLTMDEGR